MCHLNQIKNFYNSNRLELNRFDNHININYQLDNIFLNLSDKNIYRHCTELKNLYSTMLKKNVVQYECFINRNEFKNFTSVMLLMSRLGFNFSNSALKSTLFL